MKEKILIVLRWIGLLPISIIGGAVSMFPVHWILYNTLSGYQNPIISPYPEFPEKIIQPFCMALTAIWISSIIAPKYKLSTAKIMAFMWILGIITVFAMIYFEKSIGNIKFSLQYGGLPMILGIIGAIAGVFVVKKRENKALLI